MPIRCISVMVQRAKLVVWTFVFFIGLFWIYRTCLPKGSYRKTPPYYDPSEPWLRRYPDFLSDEECQNIIDVSRSQLTEAQVGLKAPQRSTQVRNNRVCFLPGHTNKTTRAIYTRISETLGIPTSHFEEIQVGHYQPGQYYKKHSDDMLEKADNPRCHTVLMYLNDVNEGGETSFPTYDLKVKPKRGEAIVFRPVAYRKDRGFESIPQLEHEALAPKTGEKWIATVWVHFFPR